jgi:DNA-binding CsgD family transcriptional regulator
MQKGQEQYLYSFSHTTDWDVQSVTHHENTVPISIFSGKTPALQVIVRYLREHDERSYREIAELLGRAESTIRVTHRNAPRDELRIEEGLNLPVSFFTQFGLSPLETVVYFLEGEGLRNVEIAMLLALDPRTTATVKRRIKEKGVMHE